MSARLLAAAVLTAVLSSTSTAAADVVVPDHLPAKPHGCVTWDEFDAVPNDGGRRWSQQRIERTWDAGGIYVDALSDEEISYVRYRRCGWRGYTVDVVYERQLPRSPWLIKSWPCPCPDEAVTR